MFFALIVSFGLKLINIIKSKNMKKIRSIKSKWLSFSSLLILSLFSVGVSAAYEANTTQVFVSPDGYPIVWENAEKYTINFDYDINQVVQCNTSIFTRIQCSVKDRNINVPVTFSAFRDYQKSQFITVTVFYDASGNVIGTAESDNTETVNNGVSANITSDVGSLPGNFSVTPSGSANYSMPIETPPGIAGVKPEISVVYDSQSGNSEVGLGWSLSTHSSITRCPQTIAQDGKVAGVTYLGTGSSSGYSSSARFCLDGQRLIAVNGSYGDNGTEYRTDIGDDIRVVSYGQTGRYVKIFFTFGLYFNSGPEKFIVYRKDGSESEFGYTEDSRIQKTGGAGVRVWAVNKTTDVSGNYATYSYLEDAVNGDINIARIDYAGNSSQGVLTNASVRFSYENRPDKYLSFNNGSKTQLHKRLNKIETFVKSGKVLTYNFNYKDVSKDVVKNTYLSSIEKCTAVSCINSTNFQWQVRYGDSGIASNTGVCGNGDWGNGVCNDWDNHKTIRYPDIDNDGRSDICYRGDQGIQCRITNNGSELKISTNICANGSSLYGVCNGADNHDTIQYFDVNADGKKDIVYRGDRGIQAHIWNGSGFTYSRNTTICANGANSCNGSDNYYSAQAVDINADSFADVCYRSDVGIKCHLGSVTGWGSEIVSDICVNGNATVDGVCNGKDNYDTINYVDTTGDGKLELVYRSDNGIRVATWDDANGFTENSAIDVCKNGYPGCNDGDNHYYIQYPDVNGDGLSDLCYRSDSGVKCHYSVGGSFNQNADISTDICANGSTQYGVCNDADNYGSIKYVDFNADGRNDLVFRSDNKGIQVFLFDGEKYTLHANSVLNGLCSNGSAAGGVCNDRDNHSTISFADFNGDGGSDFVYRSDDLGIIRYTQYDYPKPLITKITDGFGVDLRVSYKPITDSSVYTVDKKAIPPSHPDQDIQYAKYVVSEQSTTDGLSGTTRSTYMYEGARVNVHGRGELGFAKTISTNTQTNLETTVVYRQDYPFIGMVDNETQKLNGKIFTYTKNTPALFPLENERNKIYLSSTLVEAYDINGVKLSIVTSTNETGSNPNGDITKSTVTTQNANVASDKHSIITTNVYKNLTNFYLQSLITQSSVKKTGPKGSAPVVVHNYAYDPQTYKLLSEFGTVNGGFAGIKKTYAYTDGFGHINSTTITGPDIEARIATTEYDSLGQFPVKVTNEMGHSVSTTYDPAFGVPLTKTDANGLVTRYEYDTWGRQTDVYAPGGNTVHTEQNWCQLNCILPAINPNVSAQVVKFSSTTSVAGGGSLVKYAPDVVVYFDKLGREIRKQTTNFKNETVFVDTAYDDLGRIVAQTQPYFAGLAEKNETVTEYDTLNRVIKSTTPGEGVSTVTYNASAFEVTTQRRAYNPLTSAYETQTNSEKKNVIGQVLYNTNNDGNVLHYEYDAQGNRVKTLMPSVSTNGLNVVNPKGTVVEVQYDDFGRKKAMIDPNMGSWTYTYDSTSKLRTQTNAIGQKTTMNYDRLGRMVNRTDADGRKTTWVYNDDLVRGNTPVAMSIGKLDSVSQIRAGGVEEYRQNITYTTDLGLVSSSTTIIEEGSATQSKKVSYTTLSNYDEFHRPEIVSYPETTPNKRLQLKYVYTNGALTEVNNANGLVSYWQAKDANARGQITLADYGVSQSHLNGVISQTAGHDIAGRLTFLDYSSGLSTLYNSSYQYNDHGSLVSRKSLRNNTVNFLTEKYYYDSLQRLTRVNINNNANAQLYTYDALGNIRSKTGQGTYQYSSAKPHAVSRVNGSNYIYNNNGAITSGGGRSVSWSAFNKPTKISNASGFSSFNYGPSRARYKQLSREYAASGQPQKDVTTIYVGGSFEKVTESGKINHKHYIKVAGNTIAQYTVTQTTESDIGTNKLEFLLRDNQGSTVAVINASGGVTAQMDYDAFGSRRPILGASTLTTVIQNIPRGYTGHEHLTKLGLIHMNGRVYDSKLGRFLSADPVVQFSKNIQSYNRFSYVLNNPMSYTDPSGFSLRRLIKSAARVISVSFISGLSPSAVSTMYTKPVKRFFLKYQWARVGLQIAATFYGGPEGAALASAYLTDISGGSFGDVAKAALTSYVASLAGQAVGVYGSGVFTQALARGAVGAAVAKVSGGKVSNGFWGGFLSPSGGGGTSISAYITGAIYSGLVAEITGGKFEYGAGASIFGRMLGEINSSGGDTKKSNQNGPRGCHPINIATGEKYLTMLDYKASGASKLKFERYYSSYAKGKTALGYNWRSNFDSNLSFENSLIDGAPLKVVYSKLDREQVLFTKNKDDQWAVEGKDLEKLIQLENGWLVTTLEGDLETYSAEGKLQSIEQRGGYTQTLSYNEKGQLINVSDNFNATLQLAYNRHGLLKSVTDAEGNTTHYRYDMRKQLLSKVLYPDNTETLADNTYKQYHYNDKRFSHSITGITNELGQRVHSMAYDNEGRAILSELGDHVERYDITFHNNQQSTLRNSLGRTTTYVFNEENKPISITGDATASCYGSNQGYTYDDRGNIETITDWNGAVTSYTYNARDLETKRVEALGTDVERAIETQWHAQYKLPTRITAPGLTTKFAYNGKGLLIEKTEIDTHANTLAELNGFEKLFSLYPQRTVQFSYNAQGLLTEIDGPLTQDPLTDINDITHFSYDANGNQTKVTNALGHNSKISAFDNNGKPLVLLDTNGIETHLAYNSRGWLQSKTLKLHDGNATTQYEYAHSGNYKGQGQVSKVTLPNDEQVSYEYDKAYRVIGIHNSQGERISYTLDLEGNRIAETTHNAQGELVRTQQRVFDELSRLLAHIGANQQTTSYQYNKNGQLETVTDALKNKTTQAFDALNRLIATTDVNEGVIKQTYDQQGRVTSISDQRKLTTEYRYNGFGDKIAQISPDTGTTLFSYNEAGQLIRKTDARSVETLYHYDVLGRITDIQYPASSADDIHYAYDKHSEESENAIGRLAEVTDPSGSSQFAYNPQGQVQQKDYRIGETNYRIKNHYNAYGALVGTTYPSGRVVNYQFNQQGQISGVTTQTSAATEHVESVVSQAQYLPFGPLANINYGNGTELAIERDKDYRIASIQLKDNEIVDSLYNVNYDYDAANNITQINDALNTKQTQTFVYDNVYRLTAADGSYGRVEYDYDKVGNRLQRRLTDSDSANAIVEEYDYAHDSNRLLSVAQHNSGHNSANTSERLLSYDAVGNIVNDQKSAENNTALIYGANNRLQGIDKTSKDINGAVYLYNAKGQRVSKTVTQTDGSLEVTHFHYNGANQLMAETNALGEAVREYLYMGNERVAKVEYSDDASGQLVFIHNDHLGSPQLMTDSFRRVVWTSDTLPFGQSVAMLSDEKQKLRFPGQYFDGESGYAYNYFRDYDSSLGRYMQSDPIGLRGGVNTFGYVVGNPVGGFDAVGLTTTLITTYDYGIGSHSALHIQNNAETFLYDPAGSYLAETGTRGSGDFFSGSRANLNAYIKYQGSTGSTVSIQTLNIDAATEAKIIERAIDQGGIMPFACASGVSGALGGACGISDSSLPGSLENNVKSVIKAAKETEGKQACE